MPIVNILIVYQLKDSVRFYLLENISEEDFKVLECLKNEIGNNDELQIIDDAITPDIDKCFGKRKEYYCKWANCQINMPIYKKDIFAIYHYDART